jgi:hypothetical protein
VRDVRTNGRIDIVGACAAVALALLASCGADGPPPRTLTTADVAGMPPGSATGSTFSGTYVVTAAALDACVCRTGSCATFHGMTGGVTVAVETDGKLTLNTDCVGGVDADGTFWCGGTTSVPENLQIGVNNGKFTTNAAGMPTGFQSTEELTIVATIGPQNFDCDLRGHATARFAGP